MTKNSAISRSAQPSGQFTSTAGGVFPEWLEGKTLPGVAALANIGDTLGTPK